MGLLSTLGGIAGTFLGGPIGGTIGSALGGSLEGSESVGEAAQVQVGSAQEGIDEQRAQLAAIQQLLQPYTQAGAGAITQQQALLGMGTPEAQQQAITALEGSPQFQALAQQGEEAILSRASATGGLRGGNVQAALAQFRPALLSQLINQQYERLGGLASGGGTQAARLGQFTQQTGANISNLITGKGAAQAGGILGEQGALTGGINKAFGAVQGAGGFEKLLGGGGGFSGMQAQFSQTPIGSSGFGSGLAYGNQDLGSYF
jgi:hypothetical protein